LNAIPQEVTLPWFWEPALVAQLPPLYRAYAGYSSVVFDRSTGRVPGGSWLLRMLARVTALLRLQDAIPLRLAQGTLYVDLLDSRLLTVLHEARASGGERRILDQVLAKGDSFVDVGANHGSYSLIAAATVGSRGAVIACEPQPRLVALLRQSLESSGYRHARVHEVACAEREGTADLFIPLRGSGSAGVYESFSALGTHRTVRVRSARLDSLIPWQTLPGRVFLKLDVEGSELSVLRGAERFIRGRQPTILFEINSASARAAGHTPAAVIECLRSLGYSRFAEVEEYPRPRSFDDLRPETQRNAVAIPDGAPATGTR